MNSCDFRVFLQEFGTTVHLSLPGSVSEKERLLLKLLMQGMSVTEISQYRNRSAKTISHQKKQLFEKLGIQSDITFWRDIFFQYNPEIISATGSNSHRYINDNHYHHIVTPEAISLALENHEFKPWIQPAEIGNGNYESIKAQAVATYTLLYKRNQNGNYPTGSVYSSGGVIRSYCHNDPPTDETDCGYSDAGKTFAAGQFPYWHQRLGGLFFGSGI